VSAQRPARETGKPASRLAELMGQPETASAVLRALLRDLRIQVRNGRPVPSWAHDVLVELAALAEVESPAIGTAPEIVSPSDSRSRLVSVREASDAVDRSEEYVRRLVRTHRVRGERVGARTWLIDLDSLEGVIGNAQQKRAS
jgi:hypothetical protein